MTQQTQPSTRRAESVLLEARITLRAFVFAVGMLVPTGERAHFAGVLRIGYRGPYPEKTRRYVDAFMGILEQTAAGKRLTAPQLETLRDARNEPLGPLAHRPGFPWISEWPKRPTIRAAADLLFEYLNQIEVAGRPAHFACAECGSLCITRRGGAKYCGPKCSKIAWSYSRRPEKLKEYREEQKRRDSRLKRRAKRGQ